MVKQLAWEGGDADIAGQDEEAPAGCGRVLEGQLRFDSARYGAALDIIFTGSIEHLRDQVRGMGEVTVHLDDRVGAVVERTPQPGPIGGSEPSLGVAV